MRPETFRSVTPERICICLIKHLGLLFVWDHFKCNFLLKEFWTHRQGGLGLQMHLGVSCGHESLWTVFPFPVSTMVSDWHFILFKHSKFLWEYRFI